MTLGEELRVEIEKRDCSIEKIKEIRKRIVLEGIKIGAAYGYENFILIPRNVDIDMKYDMDKIMCSEIRTTTDNTCDIQRVWMNRDAFIKYPMINEDGVGEALNMVKKVLAYHENT